MSIKHRKQQVRSEETATPQGNTSAKLLTPEGEPKGGLLESGLALLSSFSFVLPSADDGTADDMAIDSAGEISFNKLLLAETMEASGDDLITFAKKAEATAKALKAFAKSTLKKVETYWLGWCSNFPMSDSITLENGGENNADASRLELHRSEYERSNKAILYSLATLSNAKLLGKPAKDGKAATLGLFENSGKGGAKIGGFKGRNATHHAIANVEHIIMDNNDYIQNAVENIGHLAKQAIARNAEGAMRTFNVLRGIGDKRFLMEDWAIKLLGQGRIYGAMAAYFTEQARQARNAAEKSEIYNGLSAEDKRRYELFKQDLAIAATKEQSAIESGKFKSEKIGGSNVDSPRSETASASDPHTTLTRLRKEQAAELAKPEAEQSAGKLRFYEMQIAALTPEEETPSADAPVNAETETK